MIEDVPVISGFVFASFENDKVDFLKYSPVFNDPFLDNARIKQAECNEILKPRDVLKHQKAVKVQITDCLKDLRISLNQTEGYLKLAGGELDIQVTDFGIKALRLAISGQNLEKTISEGHSLVAHLKRNETALKAKGMSDEMLITLSEQINKVEALNLQHNSKKNEHSRVADDSIKIMNELWEITGIILDAARGIYRGVDEVKLREYAVSNLLKRVYNSEPGTSTDKSGTNNTPAI
jgi:hypothetical protein